MPPCKRPFARHSGQPRTASGREPESSTGLRAGHPDAAGRDAGAAPRNGVRGDGLVSRKSDKNCENE
jgi:hypothetical protein